MEIYVLKDGARRGPFLPFKLRELLEDKEVLPSDPGWMAGMESWAPLSSIEALESWMPRDSALPPPLPSSEEWSRRSTATTPEPATIHEVEARRVRAWLRWIARAVDEMLWYALLWTLGVGAGWLGLWDFVFRHPVLLLGPAALWVPVEALLLSRFGTTPGKWLLGMSVADDLGQALTYPAALKRSALVLVTGNGLGLPFMLLLPMLQGAMSWILYRRSGTTLWDRAAGSQVRHTKPTPVGIAGIGLTIAFWVALGTWISLTAPIPVDFPSEQRQPIEEMRLQFDQSWRRLRPQSPETSDPGNGVR